MNRRDALSRVGLIMGGTVIGANLFLEGCKTAPKIGEGLDFTVQEVNFLDEVAETIIPATKTPGAKAARVGEFMKVMVTDCYDEKDQKIFHQGLKTLNDLATKQKGKDFLSLEAAQRTELLTEVDKEMKEYQKNKKKEDPNHYFRMMKELTLLGYFTSEIGATQALRYVAIPGKYEACIPYTKGDKAWAL
jgi:DNA helicase IV